MNFVKAIVASALVIGAPDAFAQTEDALKNAFVGRKVTLMVDMPATYKGIDLRFDRDAPFDLKENAERIAQSDISIRRGDSSTVTFIKLKDDLIEFHLDGGGFQNASTRTARYISKTTTQSNLERDLKKETDPDRRRRMQREIDDLERDRQRQQDRENRDTEEYNREARERDRERALRSGSRFNLRFKKRVPPDALTADGVQRYLDPWVDFSGRGVRATSSSSSSSSSSSASISSSRGRDLKKGMSKRDVEDAFGKARREQSCRGDFDGLDCRVAIFEDGSDEIEATFVEGVLVRFSSRRR